MIQKAELKTTEDYFQPLEYNGTYPVRISKPFLFISSVFYFEWNCSNFYLMLVPLLNLESRQPVPKFQRSTERNCNQDGLYPELHSYQIQTI